MHSNSIYWYEHLTILSWQAIRNHIQLINHEVRRYPHPSYPVGRRLRSGIQEQGPCQ
jgi:hypothetical protein